MAFDLPEGTTGLRLCKVLKNGDLVLCEDIQFVRGTPAVDLVLRRAHISGNGDPDGELVDFWADLLGSNGDLIGEVALDRKSYRAIKEKWARCRIWHPEL